MTRSSIRRMAAVASALAIALLAAGSAAASAPVSESWTNSVDRPYLDCPSFTVNGVWQISHTLTFFYDKSGAAVRDTELIDFRGSFVNATTGASSLTGSRQTARTSRPWRTKFDTASTCTAPAGSTSRGRSITARTARPKPASRRSVLRSASRLTRHA